MPSHYDEYYENCEQDWEPVILHNKKTETINSICMCAQVLLLLFMC